MDLEARVRVLKAEEESLTMLLGKAQTLEDILKVRAQITITRQERESLEGQFRALQQNVAYATVKASLYSPKKSDENLKVENLNIFSRSFRGFLYGVNGLMAQTGNFIVAFFTVLPGLTVLTLLIFLLIWLKKKWKNRKSRDA